MRGLDILIPRQVCDGARQVSGCDDKRVQITAIDLSLTASSSDLHPATDKIAESPRYAYRHWRRYLLVSHLCEVFCFEYRARLAHERK